MPQATHPNMARTPSPTPIHFQASLLVTSLNLSPTGSHMYLQATGLVLSSHETRSARRANSSMLGPLMPIRQSPPASQFGPGLGVGPRTPRRQSPLLSPHAGWIRGVGWFTLGGAVCGGGDPGGRLPTMQSPKSLQDGA